MTDGVLLKEVQKVSKKKKHTRDCTSIYLYIFVH